MLNPWRLRVYPWAALATVALAFVYTVFTSKDLVTAQGVPLGGDYPVFYGVGSLLLAGEPSSVFDVSAVNQAQAEALDNPDLNHFHVWVYPPYAALPLAGLAWLPYLPSFLLFTALMALCTWGAVAMVGQVSPIIARHRGPVFALTLSFYPLLRAVTGGQNTSLSLFLICWAMAMFFQRRDVAAGSALGLLMFKPHFALPLIGLSLVARRWTVVAVSAGVTAIYFLAAALVFGWDWPRSWLDSIVRYRELEGNVNGPNLVSLLGVAEQLLGPGDPRAFAVAAITGLPIVLFLCWLFWSRVAHEQLVAESWAVAVAGIILLSPHSQYYELGLLALPMMLLVAREQFGSAGLILFVWVASWSQVIFSRPLVQPLFFLAVLGFFVSLRLLRPRSAHATLPDSAG